MDNYLASLQKARKDVQIADHMMNITYKVVNDPKMLLTVVERLREAARGAVFAIVQYERMYKRIPPVAASFEAAFHAFRTRITRRYHVNIEHITLVQELEGIIREHKRSPVEFRRNDTFVIAGDDYRLKILSAKHIKAYVEKAKLFIKETENMIKNAGPDK